MKKHDVLDQKLVNCFSSDEVGRDAVLSFCNSSLSFDNQYRYEKSFFGRRLRPHVLKHLDFSKSATTGDMLTYPVLAANRVLFAMNEIDFLMLPTEGELVQSEFREFYSHERCAAAGVGSLYLEKYLFAFLDHEVQISSAWSLSQVEEYLTQYARKSSAIDDLPSARAIRKSRDPETAARDWLIQLAPDFLIESSPMSRYAGGNYGEIGSNLFKIIIDELGYGEFAKKHSTLFEKTLMSVNLNSAPHFYWQYYLNSNLLMANYYNMITRNKKHIFRYIGAIYNAETSFITSCKIWRDVLREKLPCIDVKYFDEHCHIDVDHSRMAFEGLIAPAIKKYGSFAAGEIIRGFEEARWLGEFAEHDFSNQIRWKDDAEDNVDLYRKIYHKIRDNVDVSCEEFIEPKGELSLTHSHDRDELCHIVSGEMEFINGFGKSTIIRPGDGIVIKKNRLHGALILSSECRYRIHTIGSVSQWV